MDGRSCVDVGYMMNSCDSPQWNAAELNPYADYFLEVTTSNSSVNALGPFRSCTFQVVSDRPLSGLVCEPAFHVYVAAAAIAAATLLMALCVFPIVSCHRPLCCVRAAATTSTVKTALDKHYVHLEALVSESMRTADPTDVPVDILADVPNVPVDVRQNARQNVHGDMSADASADLSANIAADLSADASVDMGPRPRMSAIVRTRGIREVHADHERREHHERRLRPRTPHDALIAYRFAEMRNPLGCCCRLPRLFGKNQAAQRVRNRASADRPRDKTRGSSAFCDDEESAEPKDELDGLKDGCCRSVLQHLYVAPALLLTLSSASIVIVFSVSAVVATSITVTLNLAKYSHDPAAIQCTTQCGEAGAALSTALAAFIGVVFKTITAGMLGAKAATADEDEEEEDADAAADATADATAES